MFKVFIASLEMTWWKDMNYSQDWWLLAFIYRDECTHSMFTHVKVLAEGNEVVSFAQFHSSVPAPQYNGLHGSAMYTPERRGTPQCTTRLDSMSGRDAD